MNDSSLRTQILRRLPGLKGYYATIARLADERNQAINALEPFKGGGADATTVRLLENEREALQREILAIVEERDALAEEINRVAEERDAALNLARTASDERTVLRLDLSRIANERDTLRAVQSENAILLEKLLAAPTLEDHVEILLKRVALCQDVALGAIGNVAAGVLGAASRQEEAIARLGRTLRPSETGHTDGRAVDLYLDLLEASLTGLLGQDGSQAPWALTKEFDPSVRAIGRDWPQQALTMIGTARMRNLRMLLLQALDEDIPGDFIETGVWRGGACIYAKGILEARGASHRKVYVADSFKGLPEPDAEHYEADKDDLHHTYPQLAVSRAEVGDSFRRYGLLDENVVFLEGWFKDTLANSEIERLAVLRLDGDMYESTMDALTALYHRVSPGGFVIVDDYILTPCAQAIDDFRRANSITSPLQPVDGAAVWWRV